MAEEGLEGIAQGEKSPKISHLFKFYASEAIFSLKLWICGRMNESFLVIFPIVYWLMRHSGQKLLKTSHFLQQSYIKIELAWSKLMSHFW